MELNEFIEENSIDRCPENRVHLIDSEEAIIDYLISVDKVEILKSFDERKENTGVALFFHCPHECTDIVIIVRIRDNKDRGGNGLMMIIYTSCYLGGKVKDNLVSLMEEVFENSYLKMEVINQFEGHILKSIQMNSHYR